MGEMVKQQLRKLFCRFWPVVGIGVFRAGKGQIAGLREIHKIKSQIVFPEQAAGRLSFSRKLIVLDRGITVTFSAYKELNYLNLAVSGHRSE